MKILCSTGALVGRPNGRDFRLFQRYVPMLDCDGIEFILYDSWYPETEAITEVLKSLHKDIPVFHCEKTLAEHISRGGKEETEEGFRKFRVNCAMAAELGAEKMVLHLWNGVISDDHFENNLEAFGDLRRIAEEYGLDLLVENVVCHRDPMSHWAELRDRYPDIHFVFDTKMADFHRQMDLLYQPRYDWLWKDGHIRHYHVNDYSGGHMDWSNLKVLPMGAGHIDFDRFFGFISRIGYRGTFTFEATGFDREGTVHIDMLNAQFARARQYLSKLTD